MKIMMDRESVIAKLTANIAAAKADDEKLAAAHKRDEQTALAKFRNNLRKALTLNYEQAKKGHRHNGLSLDAPSCPSLQSPRLVRMLNQVKMDTRTTKFNVSSDSDLSNALLWEPASKKAKETVCD